MINEIIDKASARTYTRHKRRRTGKVAIYVEIQRDCAIGCEHGHQSCGEVHLGAGRRKIIVFWHVQGTLHPMRVGSYLIQ